MCIIDKLFIKFGNHNKKFDFHYNIYGNNKNEAVMIFLGKGLKFRKEWKKYADKFPEKTHIIITLSSKLLNPDPKKTKENYMKIIDKCDKLVKNYNVKKVVGFSLGNTFACYFARKYKKIEKIVMIDPGDRLAELIWVSPLTQYIVKGAKEKGFSLKDFKKNLYEFDPVYNILKMEKKSIFIIGGTGDNILPYSHTKKLLKEISKSKSSIKILIFPFVGHVLSTYLGLLFINKKF
ncbi:MAG: hypothetical protein Q7R52_00355 [archaeon]|nr:hypothetical protein [archaeon]